MEYIIYEDSHICVCHKPSGLAVQNASFGRKDLESILKTYYFEQTGRRITFEYSLVGGVNDTEEDVRNLCRLVKGINCHINLIPVNPIKERDYVQPTAQVTAEFKNKLEKNGINVTIRREMGRDIDGACGQLRKRYMGEKNITERQES